jgi:NhaP-type Na+/H+ or K+/H+ antiporter
VNIFAAILAGAAATANNIMGFSQGGTTLTLEYGIPLFLAMVFVAALVSSRTKIPHTMILLGFGILISLISLVGLDVVNFNQFRINPNLVVTFIIPPLIFEAMMNEVAFLEIKVENDDVILLASFIFVIILLTSDKNEQKFRRSYQNLILD